MPQPARRISSEVATVLRKVAERSGKPFAVISDSSGGPREPSVLNVLEGSGIAYLSGLRNGMTAIARWLHARPASPPTALPDTFQAQCRTFAAECVGMGEARRFAFMASIGVPMLPSRRVGSGAEAKQVADQLGLPVVMKGCAPDVPHKSEHGLVALGLATQDQVAAAFDDISVKLKHASRSPRAEIILQPLALPGIELIVGVRNYPGFGSLIVVGLGGTLVELLKESSARLGPVDERTAREMLDEIRAGRILRGFRGQEALDIDAAASAIAALSRFGAATAARVVAVEVNPLIVHATGRGVSGADLLVESVAGNTLDA